MQNEECRMPDWAATIRLRPTSASVWLRRDKTARGGGMALGGLEALHRYNVYEHWGLLRSKPLHQPLQGVTGAVTNDWPRRFGATARGGAKVSLPTGGIKV